MEALFARAARLVKVDFVAPPTGDRQDDGAALQSGLVYGFAGQVDGIVDAHARASSARRRAVIATGGLAELIAPHSETIELVDPFLTLEGLRLVWDRNRSGRACLAQAAGLHGAANDDLVELGPRAAGSPRDPATHGRRTSIVRP